jgi:hypothetical protein
MRMWTQEGNPSFKQILKASFPYRTIDLSLRKEAVLPPGTVATDLFSCGGTTYLTTVDLDSDFIALVSVASKEAHEILQVFSP